ncbi:DUF1269 domain-containing protein [Lutibacter citreus]|uniref:DUF1269 domain-containing protein n=1 Tax=Lutibacter citreus TaxID=2138210 RepID=UPI000DBE84A9|nr:DUF1269 domain-containing protein [Lutibacter citreus]
MANILVIPFKEDTKALEALHKIKELDSYGDITLYDHLMVRKVDENHYELLNDQTAGEGWRTLTGGAIGGLFGSIAGPVGFVIGLYSGLTVGAVIDVGRYNFEDNFIKKISNKMTVGTIAIVAEVSENSSVFIDDALRSYSSEIIRSEAEIEFDDYIDEYIEDLEDKIEDQREKLKKVTASEKTKIRIKINDLKAKRKIKITELEDKKKSMIKEIKNKTTNRINKLESSLKGYEDAVTNSFVKARRNRIKKRIKKQEDKLTQLYNALGEDILD